MLGQSSKVGSDIFLVSVPPTVNCKGRPEEECVYIYRATRTAVGLSLQFRIEKEEEKEKHLLF